MSVRIPLGLGGASICMEAINVSMEETRQKIRNQQNFLLEFLPQEIKSHLDTCIHLSLPCCVTPRTAMILIEFVGAQWQQ